MSLLTPHALPAHLSYSQVSTFQDCGERYRLERVYQLRGVPGWAAVGGTAFHSATEILDRYEFARVLDNAQWPGVLFPQPRNAGRGTPPARAHAPDGDYVNKIIETLMELSHLGDRTQWPIDGGAEGLPPTCPPELAALWNLCLEEAIRSEQRRNPDAPDPKDWRASGRKSKAWPDKENRDWWSSQGALMVAAYVLWRNRSGWTVATVETDESSIPAVELDVSGVIGDIPVEAFLDVVHLDPGGVPILVDRKSGKEPASDEQLGLYRVLLQQKGLPPPRFGAYYLAREGTIGSLRDLSHYDLRHYEYKFSTVREQRNAGTFLPNPASTWCKTCPVRDYCWAVGGRKANEIPRPWEAEPPVIKKAN